MGADPQGRSPVPVVGRQGRDPAAAVVAARQPRVTRFFVWYFRRFIARNFHAVRLSKAGQPALPPGRPAVIYSNHPSWWDPAMYILLAGTRFAGRPGYGPMDAAALDRYRFMRRLGIFGIEPGTHRGAADFLRISRDLLADPEAMLWVTAEGAFTDARQRPVRLRPGLAHLARRLPDAVLVPLALDYVFWDERFPEALLRFGPPLATAGTAGRSVADWQALLERHLTQTMDALAGEGMRRDPALFEPVAAGRVGIGGVYDAWRRAAAALTGRRFRPEHGAEETDSGQAVPKQAGPEQGDHRRDRGHGHSEHRHMDQGQMKDGHTERRSADRDRHGPGQEQGRGVER